MRCVRRPRAGEGWWAIVSSYISEFFVVAVVGWEKRRIQRATGDIQVYRFSGFTHFDSRMTVGGGGVAIICMLVSERRVQRPESVERYSYP